MVDTTLSPPVQTKPPFRDPPLDAAKTAFSDTWVAWFTDTSDRLALLTQRVGIAEGDVSSIGTGVTDGSDAPAGHIGEYLSASGSGALATGTPADRATLPLTAGDWDVAGSAVISASQPNATFVQAWLSTAANTPTDPGRSGIQGQSTTAGVLGGGALVVGPVRFSLTVSTDVHLGCHANFPAGTTVTASAFISARRMR
jgi:hypothetical protein